MTAVTTTSGHHRRAELAAFLRSRRERITPEQAGLPPGPRRRTPGLRREEVAQLSGVGVTWYTWLEQGRRINASPQVLGAVARTLLLDQAEREHLFQPGVPGHAHAGKLRDLLAAQSRGAPPRAGGQARLLRSDPLPPGAEERGQFGAAVMPVDGGHGGHDSILPGPRHGCQVLLIPG